MVQRNMDSIFYIHLNITSAEFEHYYAQNINSVIATSHDGQRVQFPANILRPFITAAGVQGMFKLVMDENTKLKSINRIN
ncbi:hypothetical protein MNBD_GAMMA23-282 [hydrothermal vent metagenome]|uniref:DUF2835 domain-containing protein n=1 Tax=hydrothermal vent metagenome TaxID=652676 RepID=A0A3B0ZVX3_9ZZZZ